MNEVSWYEALVGWMFSSAWPLDIFAGGILLTALIGIGWIGLFIVDCLQAFIDEEGLKWTAGTGENFLPFLMVGILASAAAAISAAAGYLLFQFLVQLFHLFTGMLLTNLWECAIIGGAVFVLFMARTVRRLVKKVNRHVADTEAHSKETVEEEKKAQEDNKPSGISLTDVDRVYYSEQKRRYEEEIARLRRENYLAARNGDMF